MTPHAPDARDFRAAMGTFATGVTVVGTVTTEGFSATTANSFTSLSLAPRLVLVCLSTSSRTLTAILRATVFSVSVLSEDQEDVSRRFAAQHRPSGWGTFDGTRYSLDRSRLPCASTRVSPRSRAACTPCTREVTTRSLSVRSTRCWSGPGWIPWSSTMAVIAGCSAHRATWAGWLPEGIRYLPEWAALSSPEATTHRSEEWRTRSSCQDPNAAGTAAPAGAWWPSWRQRDFSVLCPSAQRRSQVRSPLTRRRDAPRCG